MAFPRARSVTRAFHAKAFERPQHSFQRSHAWIIRKPLGPPLPMMNLVQLHRGFSRRLNFRTSAQPAQVLSEDVPAAVRRKAEEVITGRSGQVTVGDVAAASGVSLREAENAIRALASDSLATLKVSDKGDILYCFSPSFKHEIRKKSRRIRRENAVAKAQAVLAQGSRIAFGGVLLLSIATVGLAIAVIASSAAQSNRDSDSRNRGSYHHHRGYYSGPHFFINLSDLFWYLSPHQPPTRLSSGKSGMGLLEAIFSFVFGDADPNQDFDTQRWEKIGQYIQSRGGVVAAEELSPFLEGQWPASDSLSSTVDEAFVLPVLNRFGGAPLVSDSGDILYHFPELQKTATASQGSRIGVPQPLWEKEIKLSAASSSQKLAAIALGVLNFVAIQTLHGMLAVPRNAHVLATSGLGWITTLLPFFQAYALSFFCIPALRVLENTKRNAGIRSRNTSRRDAAQRLSNPDRPLAAKLAAARSGAKHLKFDKRRVVYDSGAASSSRLPEQELLEDWETRFNARTRGSKDAEHSPGWLHWLEE